MCLWLCAASVIIILHCHIMWNNSPLLLYQVASTHLQDKCLLTCNSVYTILFVTQERFWTYSRVASPITRYKSVRPSHKGSENLVKNVDLVLTLYVPWYCHYLQESFPAVLGETNTMFGVEQVLFVRFYNNPAPLNGSMQFHYCTLVTREPEQTTLLFWSAACGVTPHGLHTADRR